MVKTRVERPEQAIIVGMIRPDQNRYQLNEYLDELELLADTAGAQVIERVVQEREKREPAFMIGRGKAEELAKMAKYLDADLIIFDDDLSPAQVKNLEDLCNIKIIDRSGLILDIFVRNARTREARTQVELAQLKYMLPRLTRQWTHLSRQAGGIGTRGPGETQLEVDRRMVRKRIAMLENELGKISRQRSNRRKNRGDVFKAALVGYTNVGKSTVMNALTHAGVTVEDRLFATLDSTIRRVDMPDHRAMLLIDTVGFIRKLPHHLIASFKSTLEEVKEADLILHVVDVSDFHYKEHLQTVNNVLNELGVHDKPLLYVFNKIDVLNDRSIIDEMKSDYPESVFISAERGMFLNKLLEKMLKFVREHVTELHVSVPINKSKVLSQMHELGNVVSIEYKDGHAIVNVRTNDANAARIEHMVALP